MIDDLGCISFNLAVLNIPTDTFTGTVTNGQAGNGSGSSAGVHGGAGARSAAGAPPAQPVVARIVSRGKANSAASDFGALEVFGGASIGHTDPYAVIAAVDAQLARSA